MYKSTAVAAISRLSCVAMLGAALTLFPAILRISDDVAEAKTAAKCRNDLRTCTKACDSITNTNPAMGPTKAACIGRCNLAALRCDLGHPTDRPIKNAPSTKTIPIMKGPKVAPMVPVNRTTPFTAASSQRIGR